CKDIYLGKFKRGRDTKVPQSGGPPKKVGDEAVHKELGDRMERAATTASCLTPEQYSAIYASLVKQFWQTTALSIIKDGVMAITTTIDRNVKVLITEASIIRHLKLGDSEGLSTLPTKEIFQQLALMGAAKVLADAVKQGRSVGNVQIYTRQRRRVNTISTLVSTVDVSTASEMVNTAGLKVRDKGKAVMQECEPTKKIKKRNQVQMSIDEELVQKLHEEELARFNDEQ
nr:hypothetical protein [Tanacetum cinerariifolium]